MQLDEVKEKFARRRGTLQWFFAGDPGETFDAEMTFLIAEIERQQWLIEWVNENGSFREDEWPMWEKLQASKEPWNEEPWKPVEE